MARLFYGWRIVAVCLLAAVFANALGLFGAGVYLHTLIETRGWTTGVVSGAITLFYGVSAVLLIPVGGIIARFGPRLVFGAGSVALAGGVACLGRVDSPWQVYAAFFCMGVGWASLSTTAVATTLAPWFERYQGRAVSMASLGASVGGMAGVPILLLGIGHLGFAATTAVAAAAMLLVLVPLSLLVLRRRPQDIGLFPDGAMSGPAVTAPRMAGLTRGQALRTRALRSVMLGFGLGMMIQVGFATHQVTLLSAELGPSGISATVFGTALAALCSRLVLSRFADQMSARLTAAAMMAIAACALTAMALQPTAVVLVLGSLAMGLTIGNVTTLAPIIVRREFGAASFGAVYGVASFVIQLAIALGPSFYGLLRDASGSYALPLLLVAAMDVAAAVAVWFGGRGPTAARP